VALRLLNVACRTAHLVAVVWLVGGAAWGVGTERLGPALWWTTGTGLVLVGLEVAAAGARWLVEVRGLAVLLKLGVLGALPWVGEARVTVLLAVVVLASAGAHAPRWLRHAPLGRAWLALAAPEEAERGHNVPARPVPRSGRLSDPEDRP
jgi:hypothetical protein